MRRVVVLGTGTAVGKTYVTVALARELHRRAPAQAVICLKPIETGVRTGAQATEATDAAVLEAATFYARAPQPHPLYAFPTPVSPHRAAQMAGVSIDLQRLQTWLNECDNAIHDNAFMVIETAGGVFSPLSARTTNLDLAKMLEPAIWLLVAPDALGVLHDLSATLHAMRSVARPPDLIVLSSARGVDESSGGNLAEAVELGIANPIAAFARDDDKAAAALVDALLAIG